MSAGQAIAVDTSVAVKWFFDEPYSDRALSLRDAIRSGLYHAVAPDLIFAELSNTVSKRVVFQGFDPEEGAVILATFASLPFRIIPSLALLDMAYRISVDQKQNCYDALFLALSVALETDLVTADEKFYRGVHQSFPRVSWIADWLPDYGL
jgi:predicted nucleic acid-binding protein